MEANKNATKLNVFLLACLLALLFIPLLQSYIRVVIFYPIFILWFLTSYKIDGKRIVYRNSGILFLAYISILYFATFLITGSQTYLTRIVTVFLISHSSILVFTFYSRHIDIIKKYSLFIFLCIALGLITTIPGLIKYPMASRILATTGENYPGQYELYKKIGIGGYEFIYSLVIFVIFAPATLKCNKGIKKLFVLLVFVCSLLCIFISGYTTAILLSLILMFISFFISRRNANIVLSLIVIGMIAAVLLILANPILIMIANLADRFNVYYVSTRIEELLEAESLNNFFTLERVQLYSNAITNFVNSPIFGKVTNSSILKSGHSEILGYLENFGIFGFPYLLFMISFFGKQRQMIKSHYVRHSLICCHIFYVVFSFINNSDVAYPLVWTAYFVIPTLALIYDKNQIEHSLESSYENRLCFKFHESSSKTSC